MIIESIIDLVFDILYFITGLFSPLVTSFSVPENVSEFILGALSLLAYFIPISYLSPLISYHLSIFWLRLQLMLVGLIKRIPLA